MEELLVAGARVDQVDSSDASALMHAAEKGHAQAVELLLASEADTRLHDASGKTVLLWGASSGSPQVTRLLLQTDADTNHRDIFGRTATINRGANIAVEDNKGRTAATLAEQFAQQEVLDLLINAEQSKSQLNVTVGE